MRRAFTMWLGRSLRRLRTSAESAYRAGIFTIALWVHYGIGCVFVGWLDGGLKVLAMLVANGFGGLAAALTVLTYLRLERARGAYEREQAQFLHMMRWQDELTHTHRTAEQWEAIFGPAN